MTMAGPLTFWPGASWSRVKTAALCHLPLEKNSVLRAGEGSFAREVLCVRSRNLAPPPTASTDTASTTSCLLRSMKPNRALCAFSKADFILASVPASTISGVSVPA